MLDPLYDKETLEEGIIEALRHIDAFDDIEKAKECLRTALSPNCLLYTSPSPRD